MMHQIGCETAVSVNRALSTVNALWVGTLMPNGDFLEGICKHV